MAADADTPDGELKKTAKKVPSAVASDAAESEEADGGVDEAEDYDAAVENDVEDDDSAEDDEDASDDDAAPVKRRMSHLRLAAIVGAAIVVALAATVGWLGFRSYQSHQVEAQRQMFLQIGRQCALNLTTIDWQHADGDVQRVLDSATGQFYDQFSKRKQPFIDVLKKAQSKSVGTITEAGLESESGDKAQVLVAVSIKTTNLGVEDQAPRQWRMRITVEKSGSETKISNVAFVP
ncbi:Mce protein [Mycobacterium sp. Aquia_216]|uniref:Mce protein n=1 Tax=Mycobacterium sp. Aquia_216 TaxID=2991729 RepID=UPI00227D58D3|nr:Mce protein [Mycobacterium sp. Aquia_216]WAJ43496.1 Mce protein [Mycobacterium sp. Aquia_216]